MDIDEIFTDENDKEEKRPIKVKHDNSFTKWCIKQGYVKVTCECIEDAIKKGGKLKKKAIFALNFAHPECKEKVKPLLEKDKKKIESV